MIVNKVTDLIGNTPLFEIKMKNNDWKVYLKLEKFNPGGSMKDRMALNMIEQAEKDGRLKKGGTIVESSSGNTAIGLAIASAIKGYRFIAVVDHHASKEKIDMIKAYGGEIVVVGDNYGVDQVAVVEREKTAKRMADKNTRSGVCIVGSGEGLHGRGRCGAYPAAGLLSLLLRCDRKRQKARRERACISGRKIQHRLRGL